MRIAVLGAVCFDEIIALDGARSSSFGGILYNAAAFSSVLEPGDAVVPLSHVGADRYPAVVEEFERLPGVDPSGLIQTPGPLTHVTLKWRTNSWRDETILNRMPLAGAEMLDRALDCEALHINFINGTEIALAGLAAFRRRYPGLVSMDVHQLIARFDAGGKRHIVGCPDWRVWVQHVDVLQCNEFELTTLLGQPCDTAAECIAAAQAVCEAGPRWVCVTRGPEGAVLVYRQDSAYRAAALGVMPQEGEVVDTTGCGDSFSAGFITGLLRHGDAVTALACGNVVAGINARHRGIGAMPEVRAHLERPRSHFPELCERAADWAGDPVPA